MRATGLASTGVNGIKLNDKEYVAGAFSLEPSNDLFFVLSDGQAKRINVDQFPKQGRYGQGVIAWKVNGEKVVGVANQKGTVKATIFLKKLAAKASRLDSVPVVGRQAGGKQLIDLKEGDEIVGLIVPSDVQSFIFEKKAKKGAGKKKKPAKAADKKA